MSESEQLQFFMCKQCQSIYLLKDIGDFCCRNCNGKEFKQLKGKYIIYCPRCLVYWPRHVLRLICDPGEPLECPSKYCSGRLSVIFPEEESEEVAESHEVPEAAPEDSEDLAPSGDSIGEDAESGDDVGSDGSISELSDTAASVAGGETARNAETEGTGPDMAGAAEPEAGREDVGIAETVEKPEGIVDNNSDRTKIMDAPKLSLKNVAPLVVAMDKPDVDLSLDPQMLSQELSEKELRAMLDVLLKDKNEFMESFSGNWPKLELLYYTFIQRLNANPQYGLEEPVQNVLYVGLLGGDLENLYRIVKFICPLIETYPSMKIVFLGNYLGGSKDDLFLLAILLLLYLIFPENITLLRGKFDFEEEILKNHLFAKIAEFFGDDSRLSSSFYRLILNSLRRLAFYHIGSINLGQIRIFSSGYSVVWDHENDDAFDLKEFTKEKITQSFAFIDLDKYSRSIYETIPNETNISRFFKKNNIHYFVRSRDNDEVGVEFSFNNLCCTISSKGENGKIVNLMMGVPPQIYEIKDDVLQKELRERFGIEF